MCEDMNGMSKYHSFDARTGTAESFVPLLKEDLKVSCTVIKTNTRNGKVDRRETVVIYKAAPKSECKISSDF